MFDRTTVVHAREAPAYPQTVNVHEHRAPTDASIELYHELLEKARAEVLSTVISALPDNVLTHVRIELVRSDLARETIAHVGFRLNGRQIRTKVKVDESPGEAAMRAFVIELAKAAGPELIRALMR